MTGSPLPLYLERMTGKKAEKELYETGISNMNNKKFKLMIIKILGWREEWTNSVRSSLKRSDIKTE